MFIMRVWLARQLRQNLVLDAADDEGSRDVDGVANAHYSQVPAQNTNRTSQAHDAPLSEKE